MKMAIRDEDRSYHLRRYYERRLGAIESLGGKCVICGQESDLEIDHIDPKTKSLEISKFWSVAKDRYEEELRKCQLLCKNHHRLKTDSEQTKREHGTYAMYRRGKCRCPECVEANRAYSRKIYAQKKQAPAV